MNKGKEMDKIERVFMWLSRLQEPEKLKVWVDHEQRLNVMCVDYGCAHKVWNLRHCLTPDVKGLNVFIQSNYFASYPIR